MPVCGSWGRRSCLRVSGCLYVLGAGLQVLDFGAWGGGGGLSLRGFEIGRWVNGVGVGVGTLGSPLL